MKSIRPYRQHTCGKWRYKKDRLDIANAFAEFYKTLYADARKILDAISTRGQDALDDIADISQSEVAEQFKTMKKGRAPTTR